jgi:2-amino-4-hydroxy-6-hydroxymethyldihydropteridine diphosphokinase
MEAVNDSLLLAFGSNLGDRESYIHNAVKSLSQIEGMHLLALSDLFETEPVGPPQPFYINAAALFRASLPPEEILNAGRKAEEEAGRTRTELWGARTLDVDIILYGARIIKTRDLEIPHPRFRGREFVLLPACQIAGDMIDPITGKSLKCLLQKLQSPKER